MGMVAPGAAQRFHAGSHAGLTHPRQGCRPVRRVPPLAKGAVLIGAFWVPPWMPWALGRYGVENSNKGKGLVGGIRAAVGLAQLFKSSLGKPTADGLPLPHAGPTHDPFMLICDPRFQTGGRSSLLPLCAYSQGVATVPQVRPRRGSPTATVLIRHRIGAMLACSRVPCMLAATHA